VDFTGVVETQQLGFFNGSFFFAHILCLEAQHEMRLEYTSTGANIAVISIVKEREGEKDFNQDKSGEMHICFVYTHFTKALKF
jgi:hypothetical protein